LAGPFRGSARGNLAHSCLLKARFTTEGGLSDTLRTGTIQPHDLHPHAAKLLFSNHTSSRPMIGKASHKCAVEYIVNPYQLAWVLGFQSFSQLKSFEHPAESEEKATVTAVPRCMLHARQVCA
jgi:hypothetical protein